MAVKLVLLKTNENVIADVSQILVEPKEEGQDPHLVGYYLKYPCNINIYNDTQEDGTNSVKLRLTPWMPLTKDETIPLVADWIVTITEPIDELKQTFDKVYTEYETRKAETNSADEQLTDSESD